MSTLPTSEGGAEVAAAAAGAATPSVGLHGTVALFDATQEEWSEYAERLELCLTVNDIVVAAKRRAILLNAVGPTTYRLPLVSPESVTELTFKRLVELAKVHVNPKPSPIIQDQYSKPGGGRDSSDLCGRVA